MALLRYPVLLLFFIALNKFGAGQQTAYRNFTYKDGLPSSETYCVIQDSKGFIWLSTDRGIVRYDGMEFRNFTTQEGLPDNTVFEIFEDTRQRIWFHTFSSRTGYLRNDTVYSYTYNSVIKSLLPFQLLNGLYIGMNDEVWFSKSSLDNIALLSRIDLTGRLHHINPENEKILFITRQGKCFISGPRESGDRRIVQLETGKSLGSLYCHEQYLKEVFASPPDSSGNFILSANRTIWKVSQKAVAPMFRYHDEILCLHADSDLNILLGFRHHGLRLYSASDNYKGSRWLIKNISPSSVFRDKEGGVWVSSLEKGLFYLFPHLPVWYTENEGLSTAKINKLIAHEGEYFLALANDKVLVLAGDNVYSLEKKEEIDSLLDLAVIPGYGVYLASSRQPFSFRGIAAIHLQNGKNICPGPSAVWLNNNANILKYSYDGKQVGSISFAGHSRVVCSFELSDGRLLAGTLAGLYRYDRRGVHFLGEQYPILAQRVSSIIRIDWEHLLVTTLGNGIIILNEKSLKPVIQYTTREGLPSMICNSAYLENEGTVWVATNRGICRIRRILNPKVADFRILDLEDGIISNEVSDIMVLRDDIWVATLHGLSILSRRIALDEPSDIPLYISGVIVNDQPVSPMAAGSFSPKQNNIRISFSGLHYWRPKKLTYQYRLLGGDTNWYSSRDHFVVYNSLPPGEYAFEVRLAGSTGVPHPKIARFVFRILPEFYQTSWFLSLLLCFTLVLVWITFRLRIRFVRRQEQLKNKLSSFRDKALRNQMNPHFVYNALNSIQHYILKKNTLQSASLLAKFSQLMRLTFNNTSQDRIPLADDLSALNLYVDLEKMRFGHTFRFSVSVSPELNPQQVYIPPLLIQPFVENSIVHGISSREGGDIEVQILTENRCLKVRVTDNGVGRSGSNSIQEKKTKYAGNLSLPGDKRPNSGIRTTAYRIRQLWPKGSDQSKFVITDLYDPKNNPAGTMVEFYIPLYYD